MDRSYKHIIVDASNLFWKAYCGASVNKEKTSGIVGKAIEIAINKVKKIQREHGFTDSDIYFLFDNPESKFNERKIITQGGYKHARQKQLGSQNFYKALSVYSDILKVYSNHYRVLWSLSREADDLTLPLKQKLEPEVHNYILFVSADMDWARNIDKYCDWHDWNNLVTPEMFIKKYDFHPTCDSIKMYKSIRGDRSDSIDPGVPYLPKNILQDILISFKNLDDMFTGIIDKDYPQQWKIKIKQNENRLRLNYQLVDFYEFSENFEDVIHYCIRDEKQLLIWSKTFKMDLGVDKKKKSGFLSNPKRVVR